MSGIDEPSCRELLLDFYSQQINMHGSMIVGCAVLVLTLVQIRLQLSVIVSIWQNFVIYFGIFLMVFGLWYLLCRLLTYGMFANSTIHTPWNASQDSRARVQNGSVSSFASQISENTRYLVDDKQERHARRILILLPTEYFTTGTKRGFLICFFLALVTTLLLYSVIL